MLLISPIAVKNIRRAYSGYGTPTACGMGIIDNVKVRRQYFRISVEYVTERYTLSRLLPIFRERTSIS